ncbi:MAG TPA: DUF3999 family protein [Casimicrobiaceae bacterium]|nr:DUF3999 family protein [Casimicrobiaceae bacterium]
MNGSLTSIVVAVLLGLASSAASAQPRSAEFDLRLPLRTSGEGLHVVEVPEAVYRAARSPDLADLRLFNARDDVLPIAFVASPAPPPVTAAAVDLTIAALPAETEARESWLRSYALRVERDRERAIVEVAPSVATVRAAMPEVGGYLIDARKLKEARGGLVLSFARDARDYASRITLSGSDDLVNWRTLTSGPLTHNRKLGPVAIERTRFELDRPPAFVRLTWTSPDAPVIERAQFIEQLASAANLPRALLAASLSDDRRSMVVDVPEALPITRLFVRVGELNRIVRANVYLHIEEPGQRSRRTLLGPRRTQDHWQPAGTIEAFRVLRDGVEVDGPPMPYVGRTDRLRFDFATPIDLPVPVIEAEYRPARAIFAARAPGPFVMAVGHREAKAGPMLDARAVLAADDPLGVRLPVATVETSGSALPSEQRAQRIAASAQWSRYLLWGVLGLTVAGLAWMAWRLSVQLRRGTTPAADRSSIGPSHDASQT